MVDKFNIKKMAFAKDSIFNTFVSRITISFSDSDDTLRAKIGDTLPVQDAKRQGLHCRHTTHTRASRKQSAWHNRFPRVEDEICHRQHVSSSRARRWNHRKTLCGGGAGTHTDGIATSRAFSPTVTRRPALLEKAAAMLSTATREEFRTIVFAPTQMRARAHAAKE